MPKVISASLLADLFTGYKTSFRGGFAGVAPLWAQVATRVPSSARTEKYSWLGQWPKIREWLGDRQVMELSGHEYSITNKRFESTVKVNRDDILDDQLGMYTPMFEELGRAVAAFPDELIFALLAAGHTTKCYDGQYFFDTDHPVGAGTASNDGGGAGAAWYLLDTRRSLKPLIWQDREAFDLTAMDDPKDVNVFKRNEFEYGTTGRANAGLGFWQMAFRSKQTLDAAGYEAARAAMMALKDDEGRPLGIMPNLLVHPPSLEGAARRLLLNELDADGGTNEWKGTATPLLVPHLA